jgi:hypothetical protein
MNRRIPSGTYGGVRGRELAAPSYSIKKNFGKIPANRMKCWISEKYKIIEKYAIDIY